MERLVCPFTATLCFDSGGVRKHVAMVKRLDPGSPKPNVYRCPNAAMHPERPYHVGRYRNIRRAA